MDRLKMQEKYGELLVEVQHNKTLYRAGLIVSGLLFLVASLFGTYFTAFPLLVTLGICVSVQTRPCFRLYEKAFVALPAIGPLKKIYPFDSFADVQLEAKKLKIKSEGKVKSFGLPKAFLDGPSLQLLRQTVKNRSTGVN